MTRIDANSDLLARIERRIALGGYTGSLAHSLKHQIETGTVGQYYKNSPKRDEPEAA